MILLLDGRSGSGKTTLSQRLHSLLGWPVIHLEDMYPGWTGLSAGAAMVASSVIDPSRAPDERGFLRWDWYASDFDTWVPTPGGGEGCSLIIEGCGVLTEQNIAAARSVGDGEVWGVWLDLCAEERYRRAMDRDDSFAGYWTMWSQQEDAHYCEHRPWLLADWTINRSLFR